MLSHFKAHHIKHHKHDEDDKVQEKVHRHEDEPKVDTMNSHVEKLPEYKLDVKEIEL